MVVKNFLRTKCFVEAKNIALHFLGTLCSWTKSTRRFFR